MQELKETRRQEKDVVREEGDLTAPELFKDNDWVIKNPILLQIIEEAPSATQADKQVRKQFPALPAVNQIAMAVRKLTALRIKKGRTVWRVLSELPNNYQISDMFVFSRLSAKIDNSKQFVFSDGIDFHPPVNEKKCAGLASRHSLPEIFKEVTDGINTSVSCVKGFSFAKILEVDLDGLLLPVSFHPDSHSPCKGRKFNFSFYKSSEFIHQLRYHFHGLEQCENSDTTIVSQIVLVKPKGGDIYSTTYRKVSIVQDFGLYSSNPTGYEDSIVIILDMGMVVKDDSPRSIGQVIFRRKHFLDGGNNMPTILTFEYSISSNFKLTPLHNYFQKKLSKYISFGHEHKNINSTINSGINGGVAAVVTRSLFDRYLSVNPYDPEKTLNLQEMFGDFLKNPPNEIITLFQ